MVEQIRLGAFVLETPISSGGMGTVWKAHHELTNAPVAVKVIAGAHARDATYLDGFEQEVRAVARMQHPRIIRVFDFGFVDSAAEKASGGDLPRRSPWLAMELASRGSLAQLPGIGDWATLKAVLFDILDALAHSHARGIIHRDLKPGNVLLMETEGGVHCKLTDFGISHVAGRSMSTREVFATSAGTPWYMSPEQVDSRWRDYGPWTDLYALGCVAYQLASGETPFVGDSAVRVARQQLFDRPPPLQPRIDAPEGFSAWVERLLVKEIPHRFRRAADAAWALHLISGRTNEPIRLQLRTGADPNNSGSETTQVAEAQYDSSIATLTFLAEEETRASIQIPQFTVPGSLLTFSLPPVPPSWRQQQDTAKAALPGSGLGLYRWRETPFVGREAERDQIWGQLRESVVNRVARVVVIRGGPGSGKSRLAQWISQRAHELGAASYMYAQHSPIGGASHGVAPMFSRYLGCGGLDLERTYLRIRRLITTETSEPPDAISYFAAALARFIHPTGDARAVPAVRFTSTDERYQVVKRLSSTIADRRALVCVIDDAQWGYDALEFAVRMLDVERPVTLILTVRPDQLAHQPLEAETLRAIERHPSATTIDLEAMSLEEHRRLVDSLLYLEPTLREQVLEKTDRNPLFAAELLGDWVRRRVLRASPQGFRLDAMEEVPDDIYALWNRRVDRVLSQTDDPEAARIAVEVGAALGTSVSEAEWREACGQLDVEIDEDLVEQLCAGAIVDRTESGWAFHHQMLRESIAEAAVASGRSSRQHRVVAEMLRFDEVPENQLRRGLHCLKVGDWAEAAQPLLMAIEAMMSAGRTREASAVLVTLDEVLEHLPGEDRQRRRIHEAKLAVLRHQGDADAVLAYIADVRPTARSHGWQSTLADLARAEGAVAIERGDLDQGRQLLKEAMDHARLSRTPATLAGIHRTLGWLAVRFGDLIDARGHFEAARDHFQMASQSDGVSEAIVGLAEVERIEGNFAGARRYNDEAVRLCRQGGYRVLLAAHLNHRGEIAAAEGDHRTAHRFYAEALEIARLTDNRQVSPVATLNLGLALLSLGRTTEAADYMEDARVQFETGGQLLFAYYAELGPLWCAAASRDTEEWDARWPDLAERASQDVAERESATHAIEAGEHWLAAGDAPRARQAFELARSLVPAGFAAAFEMRLHTLVASLAEHAEASST